MSKIDKTYNELCSQILSEGKEYENKNRGVKRLQIPSYTLRHNFSDGFPAISNKKLYWKGVVGELIWFLRGDNDVKWLNDNGIKIWNMDAYNWYLKEKRENEPVLSLQDFKKQGKGSVGKNYSVQWRKFNGKTDQINDLIINMQKDIMSSRLKVNAWNPSEIFETALPPCHSEFQVIGVPLEDGTFGFELHWNQRSVDVFLGLPFNIASYGLLAKILEYITGYTALGIEGTLKCVHFYDNQYKAAWELMNRNPDRFPAAELEVDDYYFSVFRKHNSSIDGLFDALEIENFRLKNYQSYDNIKVEMLAPKKL